MNELVSVVIPVFNRFNDLRRAIDSVLAQGIYVGEVICIDDYSDEELFYFMQKHYGELLSNDFIKVYRNETNFGAAYSRNVGIERAKYDFIAFLDSDDFWHKSKLTRQMDVFRSNKSLDLVYCDNYLVTENGIHSSKKALIKSGIKYHLISSFWTPPNTSTLVFKRDSLIAIGGFDQELMSCQDHDLWFRLADRLCVDFVPEPLSYFVLYAHQRISNNDKKRIGGVKEFLAKIRGQMSRTEFVKFKNDYHIKTILPLIRGDVQNGKLFGAVSKYFRFLLVNPSFYKKVIVKAWKSD